MRGVGKKLSGLVKEFMQNGTIAEAQMLKTNERISTLALFQRIFNVGPSKSCKWYDELGCRTIEDLKCRHLLTESQLLWVRHLDDLQIK